MKEQKCQKQKLKKKKKVKDINYIGLVRDVLKEYHLVYTLILNCKINFNF